MTPDIEAIRARWLTPCGPCDYGLAGPCICPGGDPAVAIDDLCDEVERLRSQLGGQVAGITVDCAAPIGLADMRLDMLAGGRHELQDAPIVGLRSETRGGDTYTVIVLRSEPWRGAT